MSQVWNFTLLNQNSRLPSLAFVEPTRTCKGDIPCKGSIIWWYDYMTHEGYSTWHMGN